MLAEQNVTSAEMWSLHDVKRPGSIHPPYYILIKVQGHKIFKTRFYHDSDCAWNHDKESYKAVGHRQGQDKSISQIIEKTLLGDNDNDGDDVANNGDCTKKKHDDNPWFTDIIFIHSMVATFVGFIHVRRERKDDFGNSMQKCRS